MTAPFRQVVDDALLEVGLEPSPGTGGGKVKATDWADDQPCFGLRTYASGRRVYVVQARMGGRTRTVTIANAALVSRTKARDVARRVLLRAQTGGDPATDRQRALAVPTFDSFIALYWERMEPRWKPSTRRSQAVYRRHYIDGAFGRKSVDKVDAADAARWFARTAKKAGLGGANRCLEIMRAAFNKAEAWGLRAPDTNPIRGLKRYPQQRYARFLRAEEIARLGAALDAEEEAHPLQVAALRLLLLTGCRSSEIRNLLWSEVVGSRLKLTDSKTGPRTVWLGHEARSLLNNLPKAEGTNLVFAQPGKEQPVHLDWFWRYLRAKAGFEGMRIHDLRHSFASHAAAASETLPLIGSLLGHASASSTARYAHFDDADIIQTVQIIGDVLEMHLGSV
ncbi:tyrosine-type recombinase/integrase [Sphingomonas sp.]|uniref:tyrosine-type recombinase/integrase n=1 Tax=Sphingomonas sp. TaxID=28214 RepID=UPI0028ACF7B5|nr:tyrosine-type recombinase/integrase [Sphingomonas sp.]